MSLIHFRALHLGEIPLTEHNTKSS